MLSQVSRYATRSYSEFQGVCPTRENPPSITSYGKGLLLELQHQCQQSYHLREMHFEGSKNHTVISKMKWVHIWLRDRNLHAFWGMVTNIQPENQLCQPMKHKRVGNFHKWNERRNFPQCSNSVLHSLPQSSHPPQWVYDNLQVNREHYRMLHRLCVSHVKSLREGGIGSVLCSSVQNFVRQSSHEATGQTTQSCLRNEPGARL